MESREEKFHLENYAYKQKNKNSLKALNTLKTPLENN
jgi:hypothetical protein